MSNRDHYYNRAKVEGYRARSAFKLKQLDETAGLFGPGNTVVDLGAAPGGWMQVAAERVGENGLVVGVDRQRIDALDDPEPTVETIRGDMTEADAVEEIRERVGEADVVVSDLAPNMTGEYSVDHARSVHLARQALETALELLGPDGDFAVKVFEGQDLADFREDVDDEFEYVRTVVPDASRDSSSEVYLVGKSYLTAPVRAGDRIDVDIEDVGSEGDGVAHVEGYTLFVPETEVGDEPTVEVTEVKARFGFAERVD